MARTRGVPSECVLAGADQPRGLPLRRTVRFLRPMATIGHLALGLAAGRVQTRGGRRPIGQLALYGTLASLPDLDLVAIVLGHPGALPHRGPTHSLVFAAVVAVIVSAFASGADQRRTWIVSFLTVASHPLIDPLVAGSGGTLLLWPFSAHRVTWWGFQPIPEAFVGLNWPFIAPGHLLLEALLFSPFILYALWPRRLAAPGPRPSDRETSRRKELPVQPSSA